MNEEKEWPAWKRWTVGLVIGIVLAIGVATMLVLCLLAKACGLLPEEEPAEG